MSLVFVCQGNICRSPFAAEALRRVVTEGTWRGPEVVVASAGLLARPGRPTPAFGIEAAAARGIDLQAHRSSFLSQEETEGADAILIFDEVNRGWLQRRYPGLAVPVLMLGHMAAVGAAVGAATDSRGAGDIADPVDEDLAGFGASYDQIGRAVAGLADLLARARTV